MAQTGRSEHWHNRNDLFIKELDTLDTRKIIFLSNSITEGFDLDHYFPKAKHLNLWIGGDLKPELTFDGLYLNEAG